MALGPLLAPILGQGFGPSGTPFGTLRGSVGDPLGLHFGYSWGMSGHFWPQTCLRVVLCVLLVAPLRRRGVGRSCCGRGCSCWACLFFVAPLVGFEVAVAVLLLPLSLAVCAFSSVHYSSPACEIPYLTLHLN